MLKRQLTRQPVVATTAASAALQIYPQAVQAKTIVRHLQAAPMAATLASAEGEVDGCLRT